MRWRVGVSVGAVAFALCASAASAQLPTTPAPLPGSTFQGADGNQDDAAPYVDWQGLQARGGVVHNPDKGLEFAGGSEEEHPGGWDLIDEGDGVSPAQGNILDGWSAVEQPNGETFLYLAFAREKSAGTTYLAFELNRDAQLWNNGRAEIPCRRTGDLLVVVAAHGNDIQVHLERWVTTHSDPASSCATRGTLRPYDDFPAGTVQGAINAAPITSRLPGSYAPPSQIGAELFAETSLNLSALLGAVAHDTCFVFGSVWLHSRASDSVTAALKDFVAPQPVAVRSCAASGTKWLDLNANGEREDGEPGLPHFVVFADYNDNGVVDTGEPETVTDADGNYVLGDIRPPSGSYKLRETTVTPHQPAVGTAWTCSFPHARTPGGFADGPGGLFPCGWGPIAVANEPYASNRDFGNWLPARLTVRKRLFPGTDPGRFALSVNGDTVIPAAGDRDSVTLVLRPGTYDVAEAAVSPTDPANYVSRVVCAATSQRRGTSREGTSYTGLLLHAGAQATCTFVNVRRPAPAILVEKAGPATATWGDTLNYKIFVTNEGNVPLRDIRVSDSVCHPPPVLVSPGGSPSVLEPGETWTFACGHDTSVPAGECKLGSVVNTATGSGSAAGTTVSDSATVTTGLNCPHEPPEPQPPGPEPPGPITPLPDPKPPLPGPVAPGGVAPPTAGASGTASFRAPSRCITRASQLRLAGRQIARISVSVNGRRVSRQTLRLLQRNVIPLSRLFRPGRHRVSIRVEFRTGSDTPPVTLTRTVTVCAPPVPRFTG